MLPAGCFGVGSDGRCSCRSHDCHSPGKHPRAPGGVRSASTDDEVIRDWWERWPSAWVGIALGADSGGLWVLDIDTHQPAGGGLTGPAAVALLEERPDLARAPVTVSDSLALEAAGAEAFGKFDAVLRSFTSSDLSDGLTFKQTLDQAYALFNQRNPGVIKAGPKVHPADKARKESDAAAVPTLAKMPAAALTDAGEGEFAALDALSESADPTALEDALDRLYKKDPAAHARYMAT